MDEIFIHILTGVFLIVVGLLVKRFPMPVSYTHLTLPTTPYV